MKTFMKTILLLILGAAGYMGVMLAANLTNIPVNPNMPTKYGSIVRLTMNGKTFCSGTVITDYIIVTAAHCVLMETPFGMTLNTNPIEIRPSDNTDIGVIGYVNFATPQMDQALIVGKFTDFKNRRYITDPMKLQDIGTLFNTKLISCGYPLNGDLYCSNMTYVGPENFSWAVKGILLPGMSGGPTMLPDGTMVAVNIAVLGEYSLVSPIYNLTKNLVTPEKK
jgi:hypothetical protein